METKIYLQDILPLENLNKNGKVLLLRHFHQNIGKMMAIGVIEDYQSFQSRPSFRKSKYIVSFIGAEKNTAIFYGLYEILNYSKDLAQVKYSEKLIDYYNPTLDDFYLNLKRDVSYDKYRGRLVIDWMVPRGWSHTYGQVLHKEIVKLLPENFVKSFPGLMNIKLSFNELTTIVKNSNSHQDWFESLTRLQAIYLILDTKSGSQYVGSTYGKEGLWQRWCEYCKDGTGGNTELEKMKEQDKDFAHYLQFTILEVLPITADKNYCIERETCWKNKLGSRCFGLKLNRN